MEKTQEKNIDEIVDRMLQLYCLLDSDKPADAKEEEKKPSPSKQAPKPARPSSAAPLKATQPRSQLNDTMKDAAAPKKPLNIKADMGKYPKEAVDNYNFFVKLFKLVRQSGTKIMVNDAHTLSLIHI